MEEKDDTQKIVKHFEEHTVTSVKSDGTQCLIFSFMDGSELELSISLEGPNNCGPGLNAHFEAEIIQKR